MGRRSMQDTQCEYKISRVSEEYLLSSQVSHQVLCYGNYLR